MVTTCRHILLFSLLVLVVGCNNTQDLASQSLVLSVDDADNALSVNNVEVLNKPFEKSQQQGRYQAHLFNGEGQIIHKINFERVDLSFTDEKERDVDFYISLPLVPKAERIEIFELDGRSGHYQLKTDDPLLDWTIPENIRLKNGSSK